MGPQLESKNKTHSTVVIIGYPVQQNHVFKQTAQQHNSTAKDAHRTWNATEIALIDRRVVNLYDCTRGHVNSIKGYAFPKIPYKIARSQEMGRNVSL